MKDNVSFQHKDYENTLPDWDAVDDVCAGARKFKESAFSKGYLLRLNPNENSPRNNELNRGYLERAVLYPFVSYTLRALTGMAFSKSPKIELSPQLSYLEGNADGEGVGLTQSMKATFREVAKKGRELIWVDIEPNGDGSRATTPRAFINRVSAKAFINWRNDMYVIKESYGVMGEFSVEYKDQWRVLRLIDGVYTVQIWRKDDTGFYQFGDDIIPTDYKGNKFDTIPAICIGSQNNSLSVDEPPMLELTRISIAHFRDSADYQHASFWAGQPQGVMSGLTQIWLDEVLKIGTDKAFAIGSSEILPLPEGGDFNYRQAAPNAMPMESMAHHKELIMQMGAKLIEKTSNNTRIDAASDAHAEHSVLSLILDNVEQGYNHAMIWCSAVMGATKESTIETNKDFISRNLTPQELQQTVESWMKGALPKSDMIAKLQRYGEINPDRTLEEVMDELEVSPGGLV